MEAAQGWKKPSASELTAPSSFSIDWKPEILAYRELLNPVFSLPVKPFGNVSGSKSQFCREPKRHGVALGDILNSPIPKAPQKGGDATHLVLQVINGHVGSFQLPFNLAAGDPMPLEAMLAVLVGRKDLYGKTKYLQGLESLLTTMARLSGRYAYFQPKDQTILLSVEAF